MTAFIGVIIFIAAFACWLLLNTGLGIAIGVVGLILFFIGALQEDEKGHLLDNRWDKRK